MSVEFDFSALTKKVSELENKMKNKITKEALNAGADEVLDLMRSGEKSIAMEQLKKH